MLSNYCEGASSSSLPLVPNTSGTSHKIWESFPGLIEWKSPWFKPMPTVEVISSVFHQSSDASTCEEKKVFFWGNITSQLAHWKATRGPHYYFFAVERVFIAVNTNKLKLNIWAAVDHFRVSRGSHTQQLIALLHVQEFGARAWIIEGFLEIEGQHYLPIICEDTMNNTSRPTTSYEVNTTSTMGAAASRS